MTRVKATLDDATAMTVPSNVLDRCGDSVKDELSILVRKLE
jgi:hypothetical protein